MTTNFTIDQIREAHAKVKSGADFPNYIREIKQLGVAGYTTHVVNGQAEYFGINNEKVAGPAKYQPLEVAEESDAERFKTDLKSHQQGNTDYPTFCKDAANSGIEKWVVLLAEMSCTYYDKKGNSILAEQIPG